MRVRSALYWLSISLFIFSPLGMALFLDGLLDTSRAFRVAMPALYIVYVLAQVHIKIHTM